MRPNRVLVKGYYGMDNFGDDLFQTIALENFALIWPGSRISLASPSTRIGRNTFRRHDIRGSMFRSVNMVAGMLMADRVSLFGGSLLSDIQGTHKIIRALSPLTTVECLGVSVGPFKSNTPSRAMTEYLASFSRIIVRDSISLDRIAAIHPDNDVTLGGDLAALKAMPSMTRRQQRLTICPVGGVDDPHSLADAIVRLRVALGLDDVLLLALNNHPVVGDDRICLDTATALRGQGVFARTQRYVDLGVDGTITSIGGSGFVLSTRLHGAIVAYLAGTHFALRNYHEKCAEFARDIGLPSPLLFDGPLTVHQVEGVVDTADTPPKSTVSRYRSRAREAYFST